MPKKNSTRYAGKKVKYSKDQVYKVIANMTIKYGGFGDRRSNLKEEHIREFWGDQSNCPTYGYISENIKVKTLKWYIHNKIDYKHEIWNSDFLHGLTTHGKIKWSKVDFPSFRCNSHGVVFDLISNCPFGGRVHKHDIKGTLNCFTWNNVPALYLKYSKDSISFIAGVLAGATYFIKGNNEYAKLSFYTVPYLKQYGIPIEFQHPKTKSVLISPVWVALFSPRMPQEIRDKWMSLEKPFNANLYAAYLWKTYVNSDFPSKGIPYLKATRTIFKDFQCEDGAMKRIDKLRVTMNLAGLSLKIRDMVQLWRDIYEQNKKNKHSEDIASDDRGIIQEEKTETKT